MKGIGVVFAILACASLVTSIPVGDQDESKHLKDQVREKRGWGYEPTYFVPSAPIHTTVLGPSKTITTAVVAPPATTYVVPQLTVPVAHSHAESFVFHNSPDTTYYIHQRHQPHYHYYHYHYPTTHYISHAPVVGW